MKKFLIFVLLCLCAFILTSCTTTSGKNAKLTTSKALEPQAILKFNDIPVPSGFKPVPLDSYSFENSGIRVAVLKYKGKAEADQIVNFYKEQMPMYNWNLLNVVEYGERLLNFERESETCIIRLVPKGQDVEIVISVGPKAQMKKPNKPVK